MLTNQDIIDFSIKAIPIAISLLALFNAYKSRKLAKLSLKIAQRNERKLEIEYLDTVPSLDFIDVVEVERKVRAKLLLTNMRLTPFKIHCLKVYKENRKQWSIRNYIESKLNDDFDWKFELIDGCKWNPKGDLNDQEHFVREAGKFQIVKDSEIVLVTIPNFDESTIYRFDIFTNHGNVMQKGTLSTNGKVHFTHDYKQTFA